MSSKCHRANHGLLQHRQVKDSRANIGRITHDELAGSSSDEGASTTAHKLALLSILSLTYHNPTNESIFRNAYVHCYLFLFHRVWILPEM